jgi:CBS domain-containing protein
MTSVNDILIEKGNPVFTTSLQTSLKDALQLMAEKDVGALVITNENGIAGIFSERDFARKTLTQPNFSLQLPVETLMTAPVIYLRSSQSMEECMTIMTEKRIRHLPVVENDQLVGLISIRDVIDWLMAEKKLEIRELERFVESSPEEDL